MTKSHITKSNKPVSVKKSENLSLRIVLIAIIILSLGILIGTISYTLVTIKNYNSKIISYYSIDTYVEVVGYNVIGLNGDKDALRYGRITAGNRGIRYLNISSNEKAIVSIYVSGEMADFISVENNSFVIEHNPGILVPINLNVPTGTPPGNYSGKVYVKLTKP